MQKRISPIKFVNRNNPLSIHKLNVFYYSHKNALPIIKKVQDNYYKSIDDNQVNYIDNFWKKIKSINPNAFNGNLAKVENIDSNEIFVSFVDYKAFIATSKFDFYGNNSNIIANPLTVTPIIITKDNKLIVGYRKNTKNLQFPGGMLDFFKDGNEKQLYIEKCAKREISEELCPINIFNYKYLGASISLKDIFSTLYVYCHTNCSFDDILQTRNKRKNEIVDFWEMPEIFAVDLNQNSLSEILNKNCTGTMSAGIMLLGRRLYGKKWYLENMRKQFGGVYIDFNC